MSISSSLYLSASCSSFASSFHGAISEVRSPVRVNTSRSRRKRELRTIRKRKEDLRNSRGYVSCSTSGEEIAESGHDVITFFQDGSSSRGHSNRAALRSNMATKQSTPPLASVTSSVSTPFMDRLENFDKLDWKGKVTMSTVVVAGLAAASFAGVKLARGLHGGVRSFASKKGGKKESGSGGSLAYDVVAKGFATVQSNLGPWSFTDLTLGLAAISKVRHSVSKLC